MVIPERETPTCIWEDCQDASLLPRDGYYQCVGRRKTEDGRSGKHPVYKISSRLVDGLVPDEEKIAEEKGNI